MSLQTAIAEFRTDPTLARNVVDWRILPPEPPRFEAWPENLDPRITQALARRGIERPYTHQAQAIDLALQGQDAVIVTPTASGKTLCYNVPVLESILRDPEARALYLFPTKALAQDQLNELHELISEAEIDVKTFTYDGDTSPAERRRVRTAGHVVLTNPDMLHSAILPHHTKWVRLFENLRYIVIDELHTYRGVFGSHVGNVLRRLQRICRFYGADPTFICCSATIRNPAELATALTGHEVTLVDDSGAPRGERHVVLYNPPVVNAELGIRRGVIRSATDIASLIQEHGPQTLVFAGSRTNVELLTTYLRELPGGRPRHSGAPEPVRGYRAGYLPKERRAIEAGLRSGDIRTVVGTNALELGIDIGGLDATVVAGYPGTLASLWQQTGRAGRRADVSLAVYIAGSGPLDQYVVNHPDYVFGAPVEAGLIDPDNPLIAAEHLKCAVFELPVESDEHSALGEHTPMLLDALEEGGLVHLAAERAYWMNEAYPADEVSLRSGPDQNVVILDQGGPPVRHEDERSRDTTVIGEIDPPAARLLVHDQAIYIHDGRQYHVDRLDWEELKAYVHAVDVDYYTDAHLAVDLKVLDEWDTRSEPSTYGHGEVGVTYLATLFKKIRLHTHENIGWGKIRLPQDDMHSSAFWLALPDDLVEAAHANAPAGGVPGLAAGGVPGSAAAPRPITGDSPLDQSDDFSDSLGAENDSLDRGPRSAIGPGTGNSAIEGALHGLGQLLHNVAPLLLMSDPRDLQLATQIKSPHTGRPTVFLWESVPGGVGFSEHLFTHAADLLAVARTMLTDCLCTDGCPACVGPPAAPGLGAKALVTEALKRLASISNDPLPDLIETNPAIAEPTATAELNTAADGSDADRPASTDVESAPVSEPTETAVAG